LADFLYGSGSGVKKFCPSTALRSMSYNAQVMIAKELLEILVCPACKQALEYREKPESLKCKQCHRVYAVKDDIPIMLIDEATVEP
jgi:uncharacterized protein YbaR (Trm112 family)